MNAFGYQVSTNVLLLSVYGTTTIGYTLERILSTTTLNFFPYGMVLLRLSAFGYQCTTTTTWLPIGRVLIRLNAFGYQCTTTSTKCVWYYYNWVYIGENYEYYYFKHIPSW